MLNLHQINFLFYFKTKIDIKFILKNSYFKWMKMNVIGSSIICLCESVVHISLEKLIKVKKKDKAIIWNHCA